MLLSLSFHSCGQTARFPLYFLFSKCYQDNCVLGKVMSEMREGVKFSHQFKYILDFQRESKMELSVTKRNLVCSMWKVDVHIHYVHVLEIIT